MEDVNRGLEKTRAVLIDPVGIIALDKFLNN